MNSEYYFNNETNMSNYGIFLKFFIIPNRHDKQ